LHSRLLPTESSSAGHVNPGVFMPESNAQKIRAIVVELARIRKGLRELVGEQSSGDPLEEILGTAPAVSANNINPEADDMVVVDISLPADKLPAIKGVAQAGEANRKQAASTADLADEPTFLDNEKQAKAYPKKPPPRKRK
jgi:hypothetical protein